MKRLFFCLFFCVSIICSYDCACVLAEKNFEKDAFYYNKLIGSGINLGHAWDASKEDGQGLVFHEEYFDLIKQAGFTSVRIPINWSAHADKKSPYKIDEEFFGRVDWVIKQAISHELIIIINIHNYNELMANPVLHEERFLKLWQQISQRYKDYPEILYFELLNEPSGNLSGSLWNTYLNKAIKVIRESNPQRIIIVGAIGYNNIPGLNNLRFPEDDRNIIATFHYYKPFNFTHQAAGWVKGSDTWYPAFWTASPEEKKAVCANLNDASKWAEEHSRPLFMGEFGAYNKADMDSRVRWTSFVRQQAQELKISFAYWEFGGDAFGVYDMGKKIWREPLVNALINKSQSEPYNSKYKEDMGEPVKTTESLLADIKNAGNILWVCSHPDDEIFIPGLLSIAAYRYNKDVYVVSLNNTENTSSMPPGATQENRKRDNFESKDFLKLKDYIRFSTSKPLNETDRINEFRVFLRNFLIEKKIDLVITLDPVQGFNGHPQHIKVSKMVTDLMLKISENKSTLNLKLYYSINPNPDILGIRQNIPHEAQPYTDIINMDTENITLLDGTNLTLWEVRKKLLDIYSDSIKGLNQQQHELRKNNLRHIELYQKINLIDGER